MSRNLNLLFLLLAFALSACGGGGGGGGSSSVSAVLDTLAPGIQGPTGNQGSSTSSIQLDENTEIVWDFSANETVTWRIGNGDANRFSINSSTGVLSFSSAPDFENPTDTDANNVYTVNVQAIDSAGNSSVQEVTVTIVDTADAPYMRDTNGELQTNLATNSLIAGTPYAELTVLHSELRYSDTINQVLTVTDVTENIEAQFAWTDGGSNCVVCLDSAGEINSFLVPQGQDLYVMTDTTDADLDYVEWIIFDEELVNGLLVVDTGVSTLGEGFINVTSGNSYLYFGAWNRVNTSDGYSYATPFVIGVERTPFSSRPVGSFLYGGLINGIARYQPALGGETFSGVISGFASFTVDFNNAIGLLSWEWDSLASVLISDTSGAQLNSVFMDAVLFSESDLKTLNVSLLNNNDQFMDYVGYSNTTWLNNGTTYQKEIYSYGTFFGPTANEAGGILYEQNLSTSVNLYTINAAYGLINIGSL